MTRLHRCPWDIQRLHTKPEDPELLQCCDHSTYLRRSRESVFDEFSSCSRYTPTRPSACSYLDVSATHTHPAEQLAEANEAGRSPKATHNVLLSEMMRNWTLFSA